MSDLDPSLAFTALLEFEWFRRSDSRDSGKYIAALLADFRASGEKNIWAFAQAWGREVTR